ncbi:MAG: diaminopimelate epimerase [Pseudomonadota bacterium]
MHSMQIAFQKMHGLGNDFVVIDTRAMSQGAAFSLNTQTIRALGNRHTGIGFDQLLIIDSAPDDNADIAYRIFNQDGASVNQCGNGARCIAAFIAQTDALNSNDALIMHSPAGNVHARLCDDGQVAVDMGTPRFAPVSLPLIGFEQSDSYTLAIDGHEHAFCAVSVGNPHAVLFIDDVSAASVQTLGSAFNAHAAFPQGVNVGFAHVRDRNTMDLRVFERGVGETRACGTGACAAMVCAHNTGRVGPTVSVALPGGTLVIDWRGENDTITMTGPATFSFSGSFAL